MQAHYLPATASDDSSGWQQTVMAFLAEKERRSGSKRTVEGYAHQSRTGRAEPPGGAIEELEVPISRFFGRGEGIQTAKRSFRGHDAISFGPALAQTFGLTLRMTDAFSSFIV
jgi:hypothetical protein